MIRIFDNKVMQKLISILDFNEFLNKEEKNVLTFINLNNVFFNSI